MWANKYIGIPYKDGGRDINGLDCWGLVRLVYKNEYGIELPSFNNEYIITDRERVNELFNQYREGWAIEQNPKEGDVVLLRLLGEESHVGVLINDKQFLHVNYKTPAAVENLDSIRWRNRIVGFNSYSPESQIILSGRPNPLKTQNFSFPISPGTKLIEIVNLVTEKYSVSKELLQNLIIIVNGRLIEKESWKHFTVQKNDKIEYRAVPKGKVGRIIAFIALIYLAPYIAGYIQASLFSAGVITTAATTGTLFGTTFAYAAGATGYALTTGVMLAGSYLINAIAPIRPPDAAKDPGQTQAQMIATGVANQLLKYETIPMVLGKMRITPPLGAQNFITYQSEVDTALTLFLCWGYGPLAMNTDSLRVGNVNLDRYTIDAIEHLELEFRDYDTSPATGGGTLFRNSNGQTAFDTIYGSDIAQVFMNAEIINQLHPDEPSPILNTTVAPELVMTGSIPALSTDPSVAPYTSLEIALHFPEGMRKIKVKDENAGNDYEVNSQGPLITLEYSLNNGAAGSWIPLNGPGEQFGTIGKRKDAFTITRSYNLPAGTKSAIVVKARRLTGGASEAPESSDASFNAISAASGQCVDVVDVETTQPYDNGDGRIENIRVLTKQDQPRTNPLLQNQIACQNAGGTWRTSHGSNNEEAKKWRYATRVNLLSVTARRQAKPFISPLNTQIARTAIRLISSKQINGQLEGINAIVQTIAPIWSGGNWNTLAPTSNPASLFIKVLMSPANPRKIPAAEMSTRLNLAELGDWYDYCEAHSPKFRFNKLVNGATSVLDVLKDICAAGRASPTQIDGKWTVTIDRAKPNIVQFFSPHNSWGFESVRNLNRLPDGLRVTFFDEANEYQEAEVIVFRYGKNQTNSELYETISLPGITTTALAIDHARWHMAQAVLRRETYSLNTDMEYLVCNRGDRVTVSHDVPMWGLGSGRIKNALSTTLIEVDDAVLIDPTINYIIRVRDKEAAAAGLLPLAPVGVESTIKKTGFTYSSAALAADGVVTLTIPMTDNPFSVDDLLTISPNIGAGPNPRRVTEIGTGYIKYKTNSTTPATHGSGTIDLSKGLFRKLTLNTPVPSPTQGDLFLIGNSVQKTNDLIVLGIETTSNKNARIFFTDYAENIFTQYRNETDPSRFETSITLPPSLSGFVIKDTPTVLEVISDDRVSVLLSNDVWKYKLRIVYANFILDNTSPVTITPVPGAINVAGTVKQGTAIQTNIQSVECEYRVVGSPFATTSYTATNERSIRVPYEHTVIDIDDVQIGEEYQARLRYITREGIAGPWTPTITTAQFPQMKIVGRDANYGEIDELVVVQKGRFLEITPVVIPTPKDFKHYEIRIWKNGGVQLTTGTGDFWDPTTFIGTTTSGSSTINLTGGDTSLLRLYKTPQKISGTGAFELTATVTNVTSNSITMSAASTVTGNIVFTLDKEILAIATSTGTYSQDLMQFERPRLNQAGVRYRVNTRVVSKTNIYSKFSGIDHVIVTNIPPGPSTVKPGIGSFTLEVPNPTTGIIRRTDATKLRVYLSDQQGFIPNNDYAEIVGGINTNTLTVTSITNGRLAPGAILQGAGIAPAFSGYTGSILQASTSTLDASGVPVVTKAGVIYVTGLNKILDLRPGQYIKLEAGSVGNFGTVTAPGGIAQPALAVIDTLDSTDRISVKVQVNTNATSTTSPTEGLINFSISSGISSFSDIAVSITAGSVIKYGSTPPPTLPGTYTVSIQQTIPSGTNIKAYSNRVYNADSFLAYIANVYPEKKFYYRHAIVSELAPDPDPDYLEDYYYSPEGQITVNSSEGTVVDNLPPPTPTGIIVIGAMAAILVRFQQKPSYNLSRNVNDIVNSSSSHKATIMYMLERRNKTDILTFESMIFGAHGKPEVHHLSGEQEYVTSVPAQPGTIYYIWFKNLSVAGIQSIAALGPFIVETGADVEKMLKTLTGQIAAGQLYNTLGARIDAVDRGDRPIVTKVEQLEGQYSVKIDNGGNIAGFGLSSTGSGIDQARSQFGIRADRFWVAPVSHVSDSEPPANVRYSGYVWVDTGITQTTAQKEEAKIGTITGVDFYYNTYKPDIHNSQIFPNQPSLQYWKQYPSEDLWRLAGFRWRGTWLATQGYQQNDIVIDSSGDVYYFKVNLIAPGMDTLLYGQGTEPYLATTYWEKLLDDTTGLIGTGLTGDSGLVYKDRWEPDDSYALKDVVRVGQEFFECMIAYEPTKLTSVSTLPAVAPAGDGAETRTSVETALASSTGHRFIFTHTPPSGSTTPALTTVAAGKTIYAVQSTTGTYNGYLGYSYNPLGTFYYVTGAQNTPDIKTPAPDGTKFSLSTRLAGPGIVSPATGTTKYWVRKLPGHPEYGPALSTPDKDLDVTDSNHYHWVTDATRVPFPFVVVTQPETAANNNGVDLPTGVYISDAFIRNATITRAKIGNASISDANIIDLHAGKINAGFINAGRIEAGSITAAQISVSDLSAIESNLGTITAGKAQSADNKFIIDFDDKFIRIETI